MKRVGLVWFLLLLAQAVSAQVPSVTIPIMVPPNLNGEIFLPGHLYYFTDPKSQFDIRQIIER